MPRFYFDFSEIAGSHDDRDGLVLASLDEAVESARAAVFEMARDCVCTSPFTLKVIIRDETGPRAQVTVSCNIERTD